MLISDYPVVSVHVPPVLRALAGGRSEIMASGETIAEVLEALGRECPALGEALLCADGSLADGLAIYLGGAELHGRESLTMPVDQEEVLSIVAVAHPSCPAGPADILAARRPAPGGEAVISVGD